MFAAAVKNFYLMLLTGDPSRYKQTRQAEPAGAVVRGANRFVSVLVIWIDLCPSMMLLARYILNYTFIIIVISSTMTMRLHFPAL